MRSQTKCVIYGKVTKDLLDNICNSKGFKNVSLECMSVTNKKYVFILY